MSCGPFACVRSSIPLLVLFAFVAGAGTAISPCVLPVLPALLGAGATGGRRRPLGIVLGLAITFTVTIVGLATVVDGVGLGDGATRDIAIASPNTTYAPRQPRRLTSKWATGGSANVPRLPPALASPTASPRRRVNHFATVVLQGTYAVDIPTAPMVP